MPEEHLGLMRAMKSLANMIARVRVERVTKAEH